MVSKLIIIAEKDHAVADWNQPHPSWADEMEGTLLVKEVGDLLAKNPRGILLPSPASIHGGGGRSGEG